MAACGACFPPVIDEKRSGFSTVFSRIEQRISIRLLHDHEQASERWCQKAKAQAQGDLLSGSPITRRGWKGRQNRPTRTISRDRMQEEEDGVQFRLLRALATVETLHPHCCERGPETYA